MTPAEQTAFWPELVIRNAEEHPAEPQRGHSGQTMAVLFGMFFGITFGTFFAVTGGVLFLIEAASALVAMLSFLWWLSRYEKRLLGTDGPRQVLVVGEPFPGSVRMTSDREMETV